MRCVATILVSATLAIMAGCTQPTHQVAAPMPYRDPQSNATALVFDPPISAGDRSLALARDDRGPAAFGGFDESTIEFFSIRTDDRQDSMYGDRYERRSISERVGVTHR